MSVSVSIPKEITEYEEKIMFGLSLRKLICFSTAVVLGIGSYFLLTKVFGLTMNSASYVIIIEAMPLMALGFVKKEGMPFEKYFALMVRHKIGIKKLSYETELVIDKLPGSADEAKERKSEYAWIFEKQTDQRGTGKKPGGKAKTPRREAVIFEVTKKGRKRKRKEACRSIKRARQEYRTEKRRSEKAAKKGSSAQEHSSADSV